MNKTKIYLTGMPGSGKTTLGKSLANNLGISFIDLDDVIEEKAGISINEIFSIYGEEYFRELESNCLKDTTAKLNEFVMATGGGTPCFFDNLAFINQKGVSIYLDITAEELLRRLKPEISRRPLLKDKNDNDLLAELKERITTRKPFYLGSKIIISSDNITPSNILQKLKEKSQAKGNI